MDARTALQLAILRISADIRQTPHIFPLNAEQVAELRQVILALGFLSDSIDTMRATGGQ